MRHHGKHRDGGVPPFVDPAFAEALAGSDSRRVRNRRRDHKAQQLCRQVQRALSLALAGECGDEVLAGLFVADVTPGPDSSRLLVHIVVPAGVGVVDVLARLERVHGRLRAEVARAVTRKRAPELAFVPASPEEVRP